MLTALYRVLRPTAVATISALLVGCATLPDTLVVEPTAPPVILPGEALRELPPPGSFIAFSLREAQRLLTQLTDQTEYRKIHPKIFLLGGINEPTSIVLGDNIDDIILVGKYNPTREPITLDDLVVALRARFLYKAWPVVSIDPNPDSYKKPQSVRFEGGIENTQFGADLLEADYRLKEMDFGLLQAGISTIPSGFALKPVKGATRFWFYPLSAYTVVREGIAAIRNVQIGVMTEVVADEAKEPGNISDLRDSAAEAFASAVTENFQQLAAHHRYFSRLQILMELVALSHAMESLPNVPNISFWIDDYKVRYVSTPSTLTPLWRAAPPYALIGGAKLQALALQLRSGDAAALRKAVLLTRPAPTTVAWNFLVGDWITPLFDGSLTAEDVDLLLQQADGLVKGGNYTEALPFYSAVIDLDPSNIEARFERGLLYSMVGQSELALQDLNRSIGKGYALFDGHLARATVLRGLGRHKEALPDYDAALSLSSDEQSNPFILYFRSTALLYVNRPTEALADIDRAITIRADISEFYTLRAFIYLAQEKPAEALVEYKSALQYWPENAIAHLWLGFIYDVQQDRENSTSAYEKYLLYGSRMPSTREYHTADGHFTLGTGHSMATYDPEGTQERIDEVRRGRYLPVDFLWGLWQPSE